MGGRRRHLLLYAAACKHVKSESCFPISSVSSVHNYVFCKCLVPMTYVYVNSQISPLKERCTQIHPIKCINIHSK